MNNYTVEYSEEARHDIIEIKRYIKYNLQEPKIADNLISKIKKSIENVMTNPYLFSIIDDHFIKKLEIRKIIVDNYIIFYKIQNKTIKIVRILYGKSNWLKML